MRHIKLEVANCNLKTDGRRYPPYAFTDQGVATRPAEAVSEAVAICDRIQAIGKSMEPLPPKPVRQMGFRPRP